MTRATRRFYDKLNDNDKIHFLEAIRSTEESAQKKGAESAREKGVCFICVYDSLIRLNYQYPLTT
jgi:hypothetical protein